MYVHPYICIYIHTDRLGGGAGKGNPDMATWVCLGENQTSLEATKLLICSSKNLEAGCKESHFYSLPFRQAEANIY